MSKKLGIKGVLLLASAGIALYALSKKDKENLIKDMLDGARYNYNDAEKIMTVVSSSISGHISTEERKNMNVLISSALNFTDNQYRGIHVYGSINLGFCDDIRDILVDMYIPYDEGNVVYSTDDTDRTRLSLDWDIPSFINSLDLSSFYDKLSIKNLVNSYVLSGDIGDIIRVGDSVYDLSMLKIDTSLMLEKDSHRLMKADFDLSESDFTELFDKYSELFDNIVNVDFDEFYIHICSNEV